jgi:superfamily II DNA/RNA helicase
MGNRSVSVSALTDARAQRVLGAAEGSGALITAPTGTGKTLAYAIPLASKVLELHAASKTLGGSRLCRAVVVVPTRELALQVHAVLDELLTPPRRKAREGAVGPVSRRFVGEIRQDRLASLTTDPPAVVVGTPHTLASIIPQHLSLQGCQAIIFDEVDHLLLPSSRPAVAQLMRAASRLKERPWFGFVSATVTPPVDAAARKYLRPDRMNATGTELSVPSVDLSRSEGRYMLAPGVTHIGLVLPPTKDDSDFQEPETIRRARAAGLVARGNVSVHTSHGLRALRPPGLLFAPSAASARAIQSALSAGADRLPFQAVASELMRHTDDPEYPHRKWSSVYEAVLEAITQADEQAELALRAWKLGRSGRQVLRRVLREDETVPRGKSREVRDTLELLAEDSDLEEAVRDRGVDLRSVGTPPGGIGRGGGWELVLQGSVNRDRARSLKRLLGGQAWGAVTTDHLARGVDLPGLRTVINLGAPADAVAYLHRAGRVGRLRRAREVARALHVPQTDDMGIVDIVMEGPRADKSVASFGKGQVVTLLGSEEEADRWMDMMKGFAFPHSDPGSTRAELCELVHNPSSAETKWTMVPLRHLVDGRWLRVPANAPPGDQPLVEAMDSRA